MKKIILIMGFGAGKTYLAERLVAYLNATWLNNDYVEQLTIGISVQIEKAQ